MKKILGLLGIVGVLAGTSGCVVAEPDYPASGVSVGVYGEYPRYYYGHHYYGRPYRWHRPYDRDRYFYRY